MIAPVKSPAKEKRPDLGFPALPGRSLLYVYGTGFMYSPVSGGAWMKAMTRSFPPVL